MALKGRLLASSFTATDADIPAQILTFSLSNAPPGASINSTNGQFNWTPAGPAGPQTNSITIVVTDNGNPNRTDAKSFTVIAIDLNLRPLSLAANGVTIGWDAVPGLTYRVQYKTNLFDPVWLDIPGDITATNLTAFQLDTSPATNTARFYRILALP